MSRIGTDCKLISGIKPRRWFKPNTRGAHVMSHAALAERTRKKMRRADIVFTVFVVGASFSLGGLFGAVTMAVMS